MTRRSVRATSPGVRRGSAALLALAAFGAVPALAANGARTTSRAAADRLAPGQGTDTITPALRARGDSIFQGKLAGGMCFTCHGQNGKGVPGLGPDLTDAKWLHGDGGMTFLTTIIKSGVMKPKQSAAIMPPGGGSSLTPEQVAAVAVYVYSLSHKTVR